MRIIGYARVSSREQADNSHALEQQMERLRAAGASEVLFDVESGSKDERGSFNRLMGQVQGHAVDEVVVTRLDRLSRSLLTLKKTLGVFQGVEVNLRVLDDNIDLSTAAGKFHVNLLGALAEMEVDMLSERVRHGHRHHRDRNAAYHAPFGYRKVGDRLELNHDDYVGLIKNQEVVSQAAIGRELVEAFLEYRTIRESLRYLHSKYGVHHYASRGRANRKARQSLGFSVSGFTSWLNNPILRGHTAYGRTAKQRMRHREQWDIRYDTHPEHRLMSEEEYRVVEETLLWNAEHRGWQAPKGRVVHPLSGLVYCEECRGYCKVMSFRLRTDRSVKKHSYQCNSYHLKACAQKRSVREEVIEQALIEALVKRAAAVSAIAEMETPEAEPPEVQSLRAELAYYQAAPGNRATSIVEDLKRQIEVRLEQQRSQQMQVQALQQELLVGAFQDPRYWETLLPEEKRNLYRSLVDRVLICEGQVTAVELKV